MSMRRLSSVWSVALVSVVSALGCVPAGPDQLLGEGGAGGSNGETVGEGGASTTGSSTKTSTGSSPSTTSSTSNGVTTGGATSTSTAASTSASGSTGAGGGPDAAQLCVDTINQLRATRGLAPYQRWTSNEACVSQEAKTDGMQMQAHYSFSQQHMCGGYAQDECPNWSPDPMNGNGIVQCLGAMWSEKDKAECSGCDSCDFPYQGCASCAFQACGHFLNMKSAAFSMVACGFADSGWYAQDFQ